MGLTTDPKDPRLGRGTGGAGMNEAYLVLSEEERAKGFVRPVRLAYRHVGRAICGDRSVDLGKDPPDGKVYACSGQPGHEGDHDSWLPVTEHEATIGVVGGCGAVTSMALEIAETYARNPTFYGATYCCHCRTHLPVGAYGEFAWVDSDGSELPLKVGE